MKNHLQQTFFSEKSHCGLVSDSLLYPILSHRSHKRVQQLQKLLINVSLFC